MSTWVFRPPHHYTRRQPLPPSLASAGSVTGSLGITADSGTVAMSGGCYYFFDEFSGSTLDLDKWFAVNRIGDLANSELQCMEADNVSVSGGNLLIVSERLGSPHSCGDSETAPQNMNYASGQVMQKPVPFIYGSGQTAVIDVRYKAPPLGTGLWPLGLWLLGYEWQQNQPDTANIPRQNWPVGGWCEIDVMEQLDNTRSLVNCVVHFGVSGGRHEFLLPFNSDTRFMVYRLEWSLNSLVWKVDAEDGNGFQTLRTVTGAGNVPDVPMYVVLSTAVGGVGGGTPNDATLPQTATWDYVRVTAVPGQTIGDGPAIDAAIRRRIHRNVMLRL